MSDNKIKTNVFSHTITLLLPYSFAIKAMSIKRGFSDRTQRLTEEDASCLQLAGEDEPVLTDLPTQVFSSTLRVPSLCLRVETPVTKQFQNTIPISQKHLSLKT